MNKIDSKKITDEILGELKMDGVPDKFLAVFSVNPDRATESFILQKKKVAESMGIDFRIYNFEKSISNDFLRNEVRKVVNSSRCGGAIIQLPLPEHININYVINVVPREKDVELMTSRGLGDFYKGRSLVMPPSVEVVTAILNNKKIKIEEIKTLAVVGYGILVGRPVSHYFASRIPEVIVLDKGSSLSEISRADIVVSATGNSNLLKQDMFKRGAGVIDFGYGIDTKSKIVTGDMDTKSIEGDYLSFYTKTPGGTGPILVVSLLKNFYTICKKVKNKNDN